MTGSLIPDAPRKAARARTLAQVRALLVDAEQFDAMARFVVVLERAVYAGRVELPDDLLSRLAATRCGMSGSLFLHARQGLAPHLVTPTEGSDDV